jgi:tripartite-type tricarboxylate transporter receptor subunit TctC
MVLKRWRAALTGRGPMRACVAATICLGVGIPAVHAAGYPDHPVRIVVPTPAGGATDASTRVIAKKMGEILGQQFIIDNRGGMAGSIGADLVVRAPADGYTLLACIASHTSNPALQKHISYDLLRDFAPITQTVTSPSILISHPSVPARTLKDLIAFAKRRPQELSFSSAGVGSTPHLMMELFASMAGVKLLHVPYGGGAPAFTDVMAGHVHLMASSTLVSLPHIKSGRIRAYGVTSAKRSNVAPDIPTIAEAGLPGYEASQWFGLLAPARTPRDIVTKLHATAVQVLQSPEIRSRFLSEGAEPTPSASPEAFGSLLQVETRKWAKVIKEAGIQPE